MAFGRVIKTAFDWVVENRSRLEDALEAMPDQHLPADEFQNGLKNRGVQQLEIEQSGIAEKITNEEKIHPKNVLAEFKLNGRKDAYNVSEIRGDSRLIDTNDNALVEEWEEFTTNVHGHTEDLTVDNITNFIDNLNADINSFDDEQMQYLTPIFRDHISTASRIREDLLTSKYGNQIVEDWMNLSASQGYDELDLLTNKNIDEFITKVKEDIVDSQDIYRGDELERIIAEKEDAISKALAIKDQINKEAPDSILADFGFEDYDLGEVYQNLDDYAETVHRTHGLEAHNEFKQRMLASQPRNLYSFSQGAYRNYTLPNTDDASYFVRIYENDTVDRKGYDYGYSMNHWPGSYKNGIFHVRGDDVGTKVRRLQEVQSDIQNIMSHNKTATIEDWRKGPRIHYNYHDIMDPEMYPQNAIVAKIRESTNEAILEPLQRKTGLSINLSDIRDHFNKEANSKVGINEIRLYVWQALTNDAPTSELYGTNSLSRFSARLHPDSGYSAGGIREVLDDATVADVLEINPDLTKEQARDMLEWLADLHDNYVRASDEFIEAQIDATLEKSKMRVTPKEREHRILMSPDRTDEETGLFYKAFTEAFNDSAVAKEYGIDPREFDLDIVSSDQIRDQLLQYFVEDVTGYTLDDAARMAQRHMEEIAPNAAKSVYADIMQATPSGIDYIRTVFPDLPDIKWLSNEVTDKLKAGVKAGMKDLEPLEQFPNAQDYQLPVPYIKQAYQEEILRALEEGKTEVWLTMDPPGYRQLARGDNPHLSYMPGGSHYKQFKTIAKRFKAEVVEEDSYLKMKFPAKLTAAGGGTLAVSAYADTNTAEADARALEEGFTPDEIAAFKEKKKPKEYENPLKAEQAIREGFTPEEIQKYEQKKFIESLTEADIAEHPGFETDLPTLSGEATYERLPLDVIKQTAIELEVDPTTPMGIDAVYEEVMYQQNPGLREFNREKAAKWEADNRRSDIADIIEINDYWQSFNYLAGQMGAGPAQEVYKANKQKIATDIIKMGEEHGINLVYGMGQEVGGQVLPEDTWWMITSNGGVVDVTPSTVDSILREGGEIGLSIEGGIAAGMLANKYTQGWEATPYTRLMKYGITTAGIVAGAILGDQWDYISAATRQDEEYTWDTALRKAMGSAELAVLGEVGGYAVWRAGGAAKGKILQAWNFFKDGNTDGAFDMLIRSLDITEEQAHEIVARWEDINQKKAPTLAEKKAWWNPTKYTTDKDKEKAIAVLPGSQAGGHNLTITLAEKNPRASAAIKAETNQRAKSLVRTAGDVITEEELASLTNLGQVKAIKRGRKALATEIVESLNTYRAEVGDFYEVVKQQGGDLIEKGYAWDIDTMAIDSLTRDLVGRIHKDGKRKTARNMLKRIDKLTNTRTFPDLIELRQLINDVRSTGKPNRAEIEAFQNIIDTIDEEILEASTKMGPEGVQWHKDWLNARANYSEMKKLTNNALGAILERASGKRVKRGSGANEKVIAKALVKYGTALDGTYSDLVKKLPLDVQPKVENLVIDELVEQFTDGAITDFQAVNFPELSIALDAYDFKWPQAKALKDVVDTFAEIYQNDIALSYYSGGITTTKFAHYLTTDPVVRAQFEIASQVFNQIKAVFGGAKGDAVALVNKSAKLLEDPLNPKNVQQAIDAVEGNAQLEAAIKKLSKETAAARHTPGPGGTIKVRLYEDSKGNMFTQPADGLKPVDGVPMHRITNEDVAKRVAKTDDLTKLDNVQKARLIEAGFKMIGLNDGTVIKLF